MWVDLLTFVGQFPDRLDCPSKEAESRGWRKDTSRYCERVLRLVPSPQVRPRRGERTRQALRGKVKWVALVHD